MLLEMKGCRVLEAVNGREAVEAASAHCSEINLILMDLRMPVKMGVGATRLIREQSETCRVLVVAMSAHCEAAGARRRCRPGRSTTSASPLSSRSSARY
jgi:CheY-like chemotaxis protein